jgi:hypothetical protein
LLGSCLFTRFSGKETLRFREYMFSILSSYSRDYPRSLNKLIFMNISPTAYAMYDNFVHCTFFLCNETRFETINRKVHSCTCIFQGVTKRCRLSCLTNSARVRVYEPQCGISANECRKAESKISRRNSSSIQINSRSINVFSIQECNCGICRM